MCQCCRALRGHLEWPRTARNAISQAITGLPLGILSRAGATAQVNTPALFLRTSASACIEQRCVVLGLQLPRAPGDLLEPHRIVARVIATGIWATRPGMHLQAPGLRARLVLLNTLLLFPCGSICLLVAKMPLSSCLLSVCHFLSYSAGSCRYLSS